MKKIFLLCLTVFLFQSVSFGYFSFKEDGLRTSPSYDIFRRFNEHFPLTDFSTFSETCRSITVRNKAFLGEINPADGKSIFEQVSPAFINWYALCIKHYFTAELKDPLFIKSQGIMWLTPEGVEQINKIDVEPVNVPIGVKMTKVKWLELSQDVQKKIQKNLLYSFIGPGVIENEDDFINTYLDASISDSKDISVSDALFYMIFSTMMQDEFLNY